MDEAYVRHVNGVLNTCRKAPLRVDANRKEIETARLALMELAPETPSRDEALLILTTRLSELEPPPSGCQPGAAPAFVDISAPAFNGLKKFIGGYVPEVFHADGVSQADVEEIRERVQEAKDAFEKGEVTQDNIEAVEMLKLQYGEFTGRARRR